MVKQTAGELITTIHSAGGPDVAVDRRAKLNDRLQHRVVAQQDGVDSAPQSSFQCNSKYGLIFYRSNMTEIVSITAREILDSRGNPTVEVDVILAGGAMGRAAVPSGASTGEHEAVELRDGDKKRYLRQGRAQGRRERQRASSPPSSSAWTPPTRPASTATMIDLDGTANKAKLGANAILGVSMAVARAAANALEHAALPLPRRRQRQRPARADDEHPQRRQRTPTTTSTSRSS